MTTNSTAARGEQSAFTTKPETPIQALHAIYRQGEEDVCAIQLARCEEKDALFKRRLDDEETMRWKAVRDIPSTILLHRPENAEDVRILVSWLGIMLENILGDSPEGSELDGHARAALCAAENLNMVAVPMLGLQPIDELGHIAAAFQRRYFTQKAEG